MQEALSSAYTELTGEREDRRLQSQNQALRYFDEDVYRKVLSRRAAPRVLDVGCGNGDMIAGLTANIPGCRVFGIDCMQRQVGLAAERHPEGSFCVLDLEGDSFAEGLRGWMGSEGIDCFDVINCSMVLMHLRNPTRVLRNLRPFLADGGTLIVREVDDGLQLTYPDPDDRFKKLFSIFEGDTRMGDRHCGRKVPSYLSDAGYCDVRLEREGLSNLDVPDGMQLYEMAIPAFLDYMRDRALAAPDISSYREAFEWFESNIDEMRSCFVSDGFFFSVGFVSFTATKSS